RRACGREGTIGLHEVSLGRRTSRWPVGPRRAGRSSVRSGACRGVPRMTFDERVQAVTTFGFTERQSAFLVTVMLHAGVCLGRQYCTFAGMPYGRKTHDFFERVRERGYATAHACRHNTARLFHIHSKRL